MDDGDDINDETFNVDDGDDNDDETFNMDDGMLLILLLTLFNNVHGMFFNYSV